MKKLPAFISTILLTALVGWFLSADVAYAQSAITKIFGFDTVFILFAEVLANLFNSLQMVASWILALAGTLLNFSINLTLNIKSFVDQTPAIYSTWRAIRDITGMFIIFFLLYAAFRLILGFDAKFGDLIKNIVVAGVLINFSFFVASLGIDASNIVSTQLYNAIAPANTLNAGNLSPAGITNTLKDGGISDIFMSALKIPALYNNAAELSGTGQAAVQGGAWTAPFKIIMIGVTSIIIMLTAAISFTIAAFAFIIRFVVLLFLLAFSPIWLASWISPEVGEYSKKWTKAYKSMLVFMPVYLLLMYLALNVLTTSPLLGGKTAGVTAAAAVNGASQGLLINEVYAQQGGGGSTNPDDWYKGMLTLGVNAAIVIILLNLPLLAAMSIASSGVKAFDKIDTGKWGAAGVWRTAGRNTLGRTAAGLNDSAAMRWAYSKAPGLGLMTSKGLSSVSGANFGGKKTSYDDVQKAKKKSQEELNKRIGNVDESKYGSKAQIEAAKAQAKRFQADFRKNLPYQSSILSFMLNDRSNRQTAAKLGKEADKQEKKEAKKRAKKEISVVEKEISELEKAPDLTLTGRQGGEIRMNREKKLQELKDKRDKFKKDIEEGDEVEQEEKDKKIMDKLDDLEKKGGGDSSGENKKT